MNTIDRDKLQNLLITLHDNGYSNNTVSAVKGILTKCFNYAYYSLRHTHATVLLENGAPLKYIQQRLGHKKVDVTINVYQHLTEDLAKQGTNVLNNIFG